MDYSDARNGEWTQFVCDRFRFDHCIKETELVNIFSVEYRERYFE